MKSHVALTAVVVTAGMLGGCGLRYLTPRTTDPVIEDYIRPSAYREEFGVLSINASKRNAYIKLEKNNEVGVVCAEPPPDVGETFAKAFASELSAEVRAVMAESVFSSSTATAIAPLLFRSQGLQMYRDAASHLCFAYMNGLMSNEDMLREEASRWREAAVLIREELRYLPSFVPQGQGAPSRQNREPGPSSR